MVGMSGSVLFQAFESGAVGDEMFSPDGSVRPTYAALHRALSRIGLEDFRTRSETLARSYLDQGITFDYEGEERPFPIDAVPRLIAAEEWATVSDQRSEEHTSELQSRGHLVCRLLLEKKHNSTSGTV